eukprot:gb/GECH01009013.1/.p1 GENE.gb/GECH01009013.1/~~gb/GECH01009013.1/.p1  ORF type:complete len:126 (+),score=15.72 gb/GECH01009013.1/:1-378(+)
MEVDEFHEQLASVAFPQHGLPSHKIFDQGAPMPASTSSSHKKKRVAPISPEYNSPPISPSWQSHEADERGITSMQSGYLSNNANSQVLQVHNECDGGGIPDFLQYNQEQDSIHKASLQNVARWAY